MCTQISLDSGVLMNATFAIHTNTYTIQVSVYYSIATLDISPVCMLNQSPFYTTKNITYCFQSWMAYFPMNEWGEHVYDGLEKTGSYYLPQSLSPPPVNQQLQCTVAMNRSFRAPLSPLSLKNHHEKSSALQKAAMPRLTKTFRFSLMSNSQRQ